MKNIVVFGLGENSLDHRRREEFPAIFNIVKVPTKLQDFYKFFTSL